MDVVSQDHRAGVTWLGIDLRCVCGVRECREEEQNMPKMRDIREGVKEFVKAAFEAKFNAGGCSEIARTAVRVRTVEIKDQVRDALGDRTVVDVSMTVDLQGMVMDMDHYPWVVPGELQPDCNNENKDGRG